MAVKKNLKGHTAAMRVSDALGKASRGRLHPLYREEEERARLEASPA